MDLKQIETALIAVMEYIGKPYYCSVCESWEKEGHFNEIHLSK